MPRVGRALVTRTTWSFDGGTTPRPVAHLANLDLNLLVRCANCSAHAACHAPPNGLA
jgi:hypothetical protein